jgi:hypothetical protein
MPQAPASATLVYPALGAHWDLWVVRLSGYGLGNCFFCYFHAVVLAEKVGATVLHPPWLSLKIGPMLRGANTKRFYWRMFKPYPGERHGFAKLLTLLASYRRRKSIEIGHTSNPQLVGGSLNVITFDPRKFSFAGLQDHRDTIRRRLLGIVNDPVPPGHVWGQGNHIAVHVRLSDFAVVDPSVISKEVTNVRIPLSWYTQVVAALREQFPEKQIYVFSDGKEQELKPLLDLGAKLYQSGSDMTDLLAMAGASLVVGSNSTYSRWAVFLGDMPSIWLKMQTQAEKPSSPGAPILYVPIEHAGPLPWPSAPGAQQP